MAKIKIIYDKEACIGCGSCEAVCPENWKLEGDKAIPKKLELNDVGCNQEAADSCPVSAIKIVKK